MSFLPVSMQLFTAYLLTLLLQLENINAQEIFFPRFEETVEGGACTAYDGRAGTCRPLFKCAIFFADLAELSSSPCEISANLEGVCCPPARSPSKDANERLEQLLKQRTMNLTQVTKDDQELALRFGIAAVKEKEIAENDLKNHSIKLESDSPAFLHASLFQTPDSTIEQAKRGSVFLSASKKLSKTFNLSKAEIQQGLPTVRILETVLKEWCPPEPICPEYLHRYRTIDGTCNNVDNEGWGARNQAFRRRLQPNYKDVLSAPRSDSATGGPLSSPRIVSTAISSKARSPAYQNITSLLWQFGQLINHDMQHTAQTRKVDDNKIPLACCEGGKDSECLPIEIPEDDPFYSRHQHRCIDFIRSDVASREGCTLGQREQINMITSYIDASTVYASEDKSAKLLRSGSGGQLKVTQNNVGNLLPQSERCSDFQNTRTCSFMAGDTRVNEHVDLTIAHTLWVRQHNELAKQLKLLNPEWNDVLHDEVIFQEARRIVIAQMQHITYNEYLPIILGREFVENYALQPKQSGYFRGYNKHVDATITNSFATAAFRFGHSQITGKLNGYDGTGALKTECELRHCSFKPEKVFGGAFAEFTRGLTTQKSKKIDRIFSGQIRNKLFSGDKHQFGMDLVSLNIQRGRDHGLPSYTRWQETCNLPSINTWDDLQRVMDHETILRLQSAYKVVEDIDLYAGGISENSAGDSLLGPTFLCLVGDQFLSLKIGDRFYYENGNTARKSELGSGNEPLLSFSLEQLDEIRKTSLARILCDNVEGIQKMQPLAFITAEFANSAVSCDNFDLIPKMSLEPWHNKNTLIWT